MRSPIAGQKRFSLALAPKVSQITPGRMLLIQAMLFSGEGKVRVPWEESRKVEGVNAARHREWLQERVTPKRVANLLRVAI
jgi:hypothetical protein